MTQELIAKLESASEGSRGLDCEVARLFGWHRVEPRHARNRHGAWIAPQDFMGVNGDGSPRLDSLRGTDMHRDPPAVTTSIDAALALATRLMPGLDIDLELRPAPEGLTTDAIIYSHGYSPTPEVSWRGWASSPALALCAALLRASAAEGAE